VRAVLTPELQGDAIPDADQIITSRLNGGRLQGLVEFRDQVLPELNDQLQELASGLRFTLNAAHNDGVPWPQLNALSGSRTDLSEFAGATRSGNATIAVSDPADGSTLLAFQVDIGAVTDETDLATQINTGLGAFGTAAIGANGQLEITLADPTHGLAISEGDSSIEIVDAAGRTRDYGFSHYFGLNDLVIQDGGLGTDLAVRSDIAANPIRLSTAKLDVETPPLTATLGGPGDNRAARALADALGADQSFIARGQLPDRITSLVSYAGEIVATTAADAKRIEDQAAIDLALQQSVDFKSASLTSVNLDEELSSLITMQQAYSVTARLISVTGEMLDDLTQSLR
jgi:flagellar hook-associated protein 1 FlgK